MVCFQGTRYNRNVTIRHNDANESPVDITSWEFRAMVRDNRDDPTPLLTLTSAGGSFLIVDGVGGRLQITLTPAETLSLPVGMMMIDVERTDNVSQGPIWLFEAKFPVKKPITRDFN